MAFTYAQLEGIAEQGGFSAALAPIMAAIAEAESSGNALATHVNTNGSTDHGLWQINTVNKGALALGNWQDPVTNARMAFQIYQSQGLKAWSTYNSGSYKKYTNASVPAASVTGSVGANASGSGQVATDPFSGVEGSISSLTAPFTQVADQLNKLTLPQTWVRIVSGLLGAGLVGFGLVLLVREVKA